MQDHDNLLNKTDSFLLFAFNNAKKLKGSEFRTGSTPQTIFAVPGEWYVIQID